MSTLNVNNINEAGGVDAVITSGVLDSGSLPAGSIVAVENVIKTDAFSASLAAEANTTITGLSITHTLQKSSNKLILVAQLGVAGSSAGLGQIYISPAVDGTMFAQGDAANLRTVATSGGPAGDGVATYLTVQPGFTVIYEPGDTSSHVYTVEGINGRPATETIYVNRSERDTDVAGEPRMVSTLTLMEVAG